MQSQVIKILLNSIKSELYHFFFFFYWSREAKYTNNVVEVLSANLKIIEKRDKRGRKA